MINYFNKLDYHLYYKIFRYKHMIYNLKFSVEFRNHMLNNLSQKDHHKSYRNNGILCSIFLWKNLCIYYNHPRNIHQCIDKYLFLFCFKYKNNSNNYLFQVHHKIHIINHMLIIYFLIYLHNYINQLCHNIQYYKYIFHY